MGSRPRVNSQSLRVTHVGQVGNQLESIDDLTTSSSATLDTKAQHTTKSTLEVSQGELMGRMVLKTRIRNPGHVFGFFQPSRQGKCVLGVTLSSQTEGLKTLNKLECSERVESTTQVTEDLNTNTDSEGDGSESIPESQAVISCRGLDHIRESLAVLAPVEVTGIDDDTTDGRAVAANPFGGGVNDDIGSVLDGLDEVSAGSKGVVHDQRNTRIVGDLCNGLEIGDVVLGVANTLDVDGLGLVVNGRREVFWSVALDEFGLDAEAGKGDLQLVVGSSVQVRGRHDVVSGVCEGSDGHELRSLSG